MSDEAEQLAIAMTNQTLPERIKIAERFLLDARLSEQHIALGMNEGSQHRQLERIAQLSREFSAPSQDTRRDGDE